MLHSIIKKALIGLSLTLVALPAFAQADDGRINAVAHLGGAAVYCVDADLIAASSYAEGGIQVLGIDGQPLLFAPAADIDALGEEVAQNTLIAEANNLWLYRLAEGGFQLNGYDEHGKLFEFAFDGCEPVGPALTTEEVVWPEADEAAAEEEAA
jgi:hypothetical protein